MFLHRLSCPDMSPDVTPDVLEQALQETAKTQPVHVSTLAARTGDRPPVSSAPFHMEPTRYSTLTRLHRVTALCMRFVARLVWTRLSPLTQQALAARHPLLGHGLHLAGSAPYITAENIRLANLWWIRALQQQQYPDVLSAMQARRQHHLQQQLHLRLDGFNILRCHSRPHPVRSALRQQVSDFTSTENSLRSPPGSGHASQPSSFWCFEYTQPTPADILALPWSCRGTPHPRHLLCLPPS